MQLWIYEWPRGQNSLVFASDREDALTILDVQDGASKRLRPWPANVPFKAFFDIRFDRDDQHYEWAGSPGSTTLNSVLGDPDHTARVQRRIGFHLHESRRDGASRVGRRCGSCGRPFSEVHHNRRTCKESVELELATQELDAAANKLTG
jgi:hypothetical protein